MKKIKIAMCLVLTLAILTACSNDGGKEVINVTPTPPKTVRDITEDSPLADTVKLANEYANATQGYYDKTKYIIENQNMKHVQELESINSKTAGIYNLDDKAYFDFMDLYLKTSNNKTYYASKSVYGGRINTTQLGFYYYLSHVYDMDFRDELSYEVKAELDVKKWTPQNMDMDIRDNIMYLKNKDNSSSLISMIDINAKDCNAVEITLMTSHYLDKGKILFYTNNQGGFNNNRGAEFRINGDGQYHTYLVSLNEADMAGDTIKGLRILLGRKAEQEAAIKSVRLVKIKGQSLGVKLDKMIHAYPDKMHQEFRILAAEDVADIIEYGFEVRKNVGDVEGVQFKDANGIGTDISKMDPSTVEYIAFDIKGVGIAGFIFPKDNLTKKVTLEIVDNQYVLRQVSSFSGSLKSGKDYSFANRIYCNTTHIFDEIKDAAYEEHNPLSNISVINKGVSKFLEYEKKTGAYKFSIGGTGVGSAYLNPSMKFSSETEIKGDERNRTIYVKYYTPYECLEGAAIIDQNKVLVPVPLQVSKNFAFDKEEPFYDPNDVSYSHTIFPVRVKANGNVRFTVYNLYQNWGKYPLKQISSVAFHNAYYHLSTGVTETNCIAIHKYNEMLPDFRVRSGIIWSELEQYKETNTLFPQYNSLGRIGFVEYVNSKGEPITMQYKKSDILSSGPVFADMIYYFDANDNSISYTLRHMEMPQTDENRTYYSLSLVFNKDVAFSDVEKQLTLLKFNSNMQTYKSIGYLDSKNKVSYKELDLTKDVKETLVLGNEGAFFDYFNTATPITRSNNRNVGNFALLIKESYISLNGKTWDGNFAVRHEYNKDTKLNTMYLTLNAGKMTFKKGDVIQINFILLPWGEPIETTDDKVQAVREDSITNGIKVNAKAGEVVNEPWMPRVVASNNMAEFTVEGGRNHVSIRVDGFTVLQTPYIYIVDDNGDYKSYSVSDGGEPFEGLHVFLNEDGTYSYTFVYDMGETSGNKVTLRVETD